MSYQIAAADPVCSLVIEEALEAANRSCTDLGRNQACYGNEMLQATAQEGFDNFEFETVGDIVDVVAIESLRLSAMDAVNDQWGVALMNVQANIPDSLQTENVNLVLFGDVEVRNRVRAPRLLPIRAWLNGNVNVRRLPETNAFVMGTLQPEDIVVADGRLADSSWYHVRMLQTGQRGWVRANTVVSDRDLSALNVVSPLSAEFGPMQAFYLETAANSTNPSCSEAPDNGLLIQTPEGVATVDLWINEVKIRLGSTAFVSAQAGGDMTVKLIEGASQVEAMGVQQEAVAGTVLTIPMTDNLQPAAPPSEPQSYQAAAVQELPVEVLNRDITAAPPLPQNALEVLITAGPTALTPSLTASATNTAVPTNTSAPTNTLVPTTRPTNTQRPTNTALPTLTNTPLPTNTSVPPSPTVSVAPPTNTPVPATATTLPPTFTLVPPTQDVPPNNPTVAPTNTSLPATQAPVISATP
jgi:hypothetical protein